MQFNFRIKGVKGLNLLDDIVFSIVFLKYHFISSKCCSQMPVSRRAKKCVNCVSHAHCADVCERAVKLLSIIEHHE
jgi:hypothetical protein